MSKGWVKCCTRVSEIDKMKRRFDVEYCKKWVSYVATAQEEVSSILHFFYSNYWALFFFLSCFVTFILHILFVEYSILLFFVFVFCFVLSIYLMLFK
jgi:hypothetical protein